MKKLNTVPITNTAGFRFKSGTFDFLQLAYTECLAELVTSRIGSNYDATKGYILNGCINSGSGSSYVISAGSVFFNGEIFLVDAATFTLTGSNVAEGVITITQYVTNADPVNFTDGVSRNVHNIRKIVFQNALSGSGSFDFINAINVNYKPIGGIGQTIEWSIPSGAITDYFNVSTGAGIHGLTLGWIIDPNGGSFSVGFKNADSDFGTVGNTGGAKTLMLAKSDIPKLDVPTFDVDGLSPGTTTAVAGLVQSSLSNHIQTINTSQTAINKLPPYTVTLKIKRIS